MKRKEKNKADYKSSECFDLQNLITKREQLKAEVDSVNKKADVLLDEVETKEHMLQNLQSSMLHLQKQSKLARLEYEEIHDFVTNTTKFHNL